MRVLSLFDGMACGMIALDRVGITPSVYLASEIKKSAIKVAQDNWDDITHVGDVTTLDTTPYVGNIDLLIGGSPCQDFSLMKTTGEGLEGDKSKLFYEYLRILKDVKPKYFLLENVRMKQESKSQLDEYLGVEGIAINSRLVSIQNRPRIYWTNIPNVTQPNDLGLSFQDYKMDEVGYKVNNTPSRRKMWNNGEGRNSKAMGCANITHSDKVYCVSRKQDRAPNSGLIEYEDFCRFLTRRELEIAQTVPIGYTKSVSYHQAQDLLGDGWTIDVIAHIFKGLV